MAGYVTMGLHSRHQTSSLELGVTWLMSTSLVGLTSTTADGKRTARHRKVRTFPSDAAVLEAVLERRIRRPSRAVATRGRRVPVRMTSRDTHRAP